MRQSDTLEIRKTIRRHQLREMVPLADSTIYEMEQRGEFPRRFALSPRCIVWDLSEVHACCWRGAQLRSVERSIRTSPSASPGLSKRGIERNKGHRGRQKRRNMFPTLNPGINDVSPFLHHVPTLNLILCLVVDAA